MAQKTQKRRQKRPPETRVFSGEMALVKAGEATRFRPGVSPNPGGRPAFALLSAAYRSELGEIIDPRIARRLKVPAGCTNAEAIAIVVVRRALAGSTSAVRELCNRTEGLPAAFVDLAIQKRNPDGSEVTPDRQAYVDAVREALGFKKDPLPESNMRQEVTFKIVEEPSQFPVAPTKQKLLDYLISVIRDEPDLEIARQVADLTRALRKKYATAKP
jgi:hypothetical protein